MRPEPVRNIADADDLQSVLAARQPGDTLPITIKRNGTTLKLNLTLGERAGGGVLMGIQFHVALHGSAAGGGEPGAGTMQCMNWIEQTYEIPARLEEMGLDLSEDDASARACVRRDTSRMTTANAVKYCDNVFKVHCAGMDLPAELSEAQGRRCKEQMGAAVLHGVAWTVPTIVGKTMYVRDNQRPLAVNLGAVN